MDQSTWTPATLLQLSGGYWSACALHAGVKLDLFSRSGSVAEFAATGGEPRALALLLDALTALGLMVKSEGRYAPTPFAREYLARTAPGYLGHIVLHHHHLMAGWARLDEAVRSGTPLRAAISHAGDAAERESFEMGMFNLAMLIAPRIVPHVDLRGRRRLLDLGGGPGTYAVHFCLAHPQLRATVYDLASTRPFAEGVIERFGLTGRIEFVGGDFDHDPLPGRYDVAWLSHILHGVDEAGCNHLLRRAVAALEPGGELLVQEFLLDDAKDGPLFPALFSLNMLINTPGGRAYSEGEVAAMMRAAGLAQIRRLPIDLPNGAGVLAGVVPER